MQQPQKKKAAAKKPAAAEGKLDAEIEAEEAADLDAMRREGFARAGDHLPLTFPPRTASSSCCRRLGGCRQRGVGHLQ